ncbi:unnamed protein product [Aphanomyces euteiches]|nr:hypothetical protein AeRB84_015422 [Aphanomyces euteiches]
MTNSTMSSSGSGPMFLKKLYDMMHTTPASIGGWCQGGAAFEIKNPKEFARVMLPQYFKHSKFSSFVRQLNFYGFQKCKKEVLLVAHETDESRRALTFYHQYFIQHKPHLMHKIRRKTNFSDLASDHGSATDDVEELRSEVAGIKRTLSSLSTQLAQLTQLISNVSSPPPRQPLMKRNSLLDALEYLEDAMPTASASMPHLHTIEPIKCENEILYQC